MKEDNSKSNHMDHFSIQSPKGNHYELTNHVASGVSYEKLARAELSAIHGEWGWMIFQDLKGAGFSARYSQYILQCPVEMQRATQHSATGLHISIEGYFISEWEGIGLPTERERQGCFFHIPQLNYTAFFSRAGVYRNFEFHFHKKYLIPYANDYPKVSELLCHAAKKEPFLVKPLLRLVPELRMIIKQIIRYSSRMPERYFQAKTDEFLIQALNQLHTETKKRVMRVSASLLQKAEELEAILRSRYAEPLTLIQCAKLLASNDTSLDVAFRQRYGTTVFAYRKRIRLERAQELLIYTDKDLESIGLETGFYDAPHLFNAFKEEFGMTPSAFRKMGGDGGKAVEE